MSASYCSVLAALAAVGIERATEGRAMLHGLMDSIGNVQLLLMTNFLCEIMKIMGRSSFSIQKTAVHYSSIHTKVEASTESLKCIVLCSESFM